MTKKKDYPGGVKLTAAKARAVAVQEFGTAKGLTKEEIAMPGYFKMRLGSLFIRIHPDTYDGTGCIVVSAELAVATGRTVMPGVRRTLGRERTVRLQNRRAERNEKAAQDETCCDMPGD